MTEHRSQTEIPFLLMRGGTSRGPYFHRDALPADRETLSEVLIAAVGAGHPINIDGVGGGVSVTTKVAMLSPSDDPWADVDYFFAQVGVDERSVDYKPTCGNILVGVGPAAIEMGLVTPTGAETEVKIRAVNTGAKVLSTVQTPGGVVSYVGEATIDGVAGKSAPIDLQFMETVGGVTGALFPTGNRRDRIDGVDVTCMDVAMPMMIAAAEAFGVTGHETRLELEENKALMARLEAARLAAGPMMGLGDVSGSVLPKVGLLAQPRSGGVAAVRYFTPHSCHPSLAVTGSQCVAACLLCPGTIADGAFTVPQGARAAMALEHPSGVLHVELTVERDGDAFDVVSAGLTRTARKIVAGSVFVPGAVWRGH